MPYRYHPDILEELTRHGVMPRPHTPPQTVRDYISDLYRYEIRRLRQRLLRGEIERERYPAIVLALRKTYPILAVPIKLWATEM
jgi:hypothetical protein